MHTLHGSIPDHVLFASKDLFAVSTANFGPPPPAPHATDLTKLSFSSAFSQENVGERQKDRSLENPLFLRNTERKTS